MKFVVLYARVSSKEQEKEGYSIPAQIGLLKEYAAKNNFIIDRIFSESETAKKAGRKAFNEMLQYIKEKDIRTVLVEKTDRLYRNFKDYVTLEDYNLEVHLVKEGTVLSKDSKSHEKFIHGIKVLMAKNYIDNLSEEVKKGLAEKAKQGYYPQKAPVGYKNVKDESGHKIIVPDPDKKHYIKEMFDLYKTGVYSVSQLRKKLFEEGFNHNGKPYSKAKLLFMLHDIFYIGKFSYNGVIYDGKHDPLISVEDFNLVQKLFNQTKARSHDVEFAYTGLLTCGYCGCQLTAELKKGKYVYYHCTGKRGGECKKDYIREEELDKVFEGLIAKIPNPESGFFDAIRRAVKEIRVVKSEYEENSTEEIEKQIKRLTTRLDNLYTDKLDGRITAEYWEEKHNLWYNEKDTLLNKLKILNNTARTFDEGTNLLENFCKYAPALYKKAKPKQKQEILKMIGSNFSYKDKKVSVELTSVFDLIINSSFSKNGAANCPKLELLQFVYKLEKSMNQEFVTRLKAVKLAA